jgi:hypothetical protein
MPKVKSKKKTDPNKPKRPLTAFMRYSASRRSVIRKENSALSMIDISKIIGEEWRGLSDDAKRPFHDAAEVDHEKYKIAKSAYDASKPKRPRTAYAFYMKENRAKIAEEHPNESPRDLMKYIAESWKNCGASEKEKYTKMAEEDRDRWSRDRSASL